MLSNDGVLTIGNYVELKGLSGFNTFGRIKIVCSIFRILLSLYNYQIGLDLVGVKRN